MATVEIPKMLATQRRLGEDWAQWLDRLPRLAEDLLAEWELTLAGSSRHGFTSLVLPVTTPAARPAALKLTFNGDTESQFEALALTHWAGRGAVRLFRADLSRRALLLERAGPGDLTELPADEACQVVGTLYGRLHRPAPAQLEPLPERVSAWLEALSSLDRGAPIPRRMVEHALSAGRALSADATSAGILIHGDLHYDNVLRGLREPWLVIDPKPVSGDPHYELAPMLWNRWEDLVDSGDIRGSVRRRFHTLIDAAELDESRARDWATVRLVLNAHWTIEAAERAGRHLSGNERTWITRWVTLIKAIAD